MKKSQFVKLVQECGTYSTKAEAEKVIKAFTDAVEKALMKKEDVSLTGFGKFTTSLQKGKTGIVPATNKPYTTKDKLVPKFTAGKGLKEKVGQVPI